MRTARYVITRLSERLALDASSWSRSVAYLRPPVSWRIARRLRRCGWRANGNSERPSTALPALGPGDIEQRRREVEVGHQLARHTAGGEARPADQERHGRRGLVREHLARADAVLALHIAVVGGEQDVGVVELAAAAQGLNDPGDGLVHGQQGGPAAARVARQTHDVGPR